MNNFQTKTKLMSKQTFRKTNLPRIAFLSMLLLCMQINLFGQQMLEKKVSVDFKNLTISEAINKLSKDSGVRIFYVDNLKDLSKRVSLSIKNIDLNTALTKILSGTNLKYKVEGTNIIITEDAKIQQTERNKITVRGKVIDMDDKSSIFGASVSVLGTNKGVTTDDNGEFVISLFPGEKLQFSYVGMKTVVKTIAAASDKLVVEIQNDAFVAKDMVVTGFFSRKKSGFAGTSTVITKEDLRKVTTGNIFTTISSLDAGFKITEDNNMGTDPNKIPEFTIRGKGSFQNGSTSPIFILDGFEVSAQKIFDMDINRIESVTLLKDASATILYGSRASNGVIVIETIAPSAGELKVTYDFKPTIAFVDLSAYDIMNASEKLEYEKAAGLYISNDPYTQRSLEDQYYKKYSNILRGVDTYWLSQPVRTAFSQAHSMFVEGGVENQVRYGLDAAYNGSQGVMKGSGRDRISLGFSLIYRIKNKITLRNYISYAYVNSFNSPYGSFSTYGRLNPYEIPKDDNGDYIPQLSDGSANPLYNASLPNRDLTKLQEFNEQFSVDWNIIQGLRLKGQVGIQKSNSNGERYKSPFSSEYVLPLKDNGVSSLREFLPIDKRGELSMNNANYLNLEGNMTVNYNKYINKVHLIYAGLGSEIRSNNSNSNGYVVTGFPDDRYSDPAFAIRYKENTRAASSESTVRSIGFFGNANYIYNDRLFVDFSFRYDGSSQFGSETRFAPFWSLGGGWNIHNEKFIKDLKIVDMLKLRYSYGITGNQEFSAYQAKTSYSFDINRLYYTIIAANIMGYGNPNLKWQNQKQSNIGFDIGLGKNRYRASFNYYVKRTEGMLASITVAPSVGIPSNSYTANLGLIRNEGFEMNVNAVIIRDSQRDFEWAVNFQGATNKNKILKISNELKNINNSNNTNKIIPGNVYEEGESMSAIKAVPSLGIDPYNGKELFLKKDGTVTYTWNANDKIVAGDTEPTFFGIFGTNVFYKGWNLNATFRYRVGSDYYNQTLASRVEGADPRYNADRRVLNDRWKKPGQNALYRNIKDYQQTFISTRFVQRENMVQMNNLSLSYEFAKEKLKLLRLKTLRLSFSANDLMYISTIKQERGLDYPFQRSYLFGVNVSF